MRMIHYFAVAVGLCVPALLATTWLGIAGQRELHLTLGLLAAILTIGTHTLLILFMIVTGRILREAMRSRPLPQDFLAELNVFFARRAAYPAAVLAAVAIVAAGVLGHAWRAFGVPPTVHMLVGLGALALNLWAFTLELRTLADNQRLVDRAAATLDRIDRELAAAGEAPPPDAPLQPAQLARAGLILAASAWMPWAYWTFVVWRGDLSRTSVHPFLEASILGLLLWWIGRRQADAPPAQPAEPGKR